MYEHVTRFIADIDAGTFDERAFTNALYHPEIVDLTYRETLDRCGLTGTGRQRENTQCDCKNLFHIHSSVMGYSVVQVI